MRRFLCCLFLFLSLGIFCEAKCFKKHLENTTWIVPPSTLLAYSYDSGTTKAVSDQTVWVIDRYEQGYFFGTAYASVDTFTLSETNMVGSITPSGEVYITFYPISGSSSSTDVVKGIGQFKKKDGKYRFVMQMNSADGTPQGLSHWSYMISVLPNDYFYQHLPGIGKSVPQFINSFK